jgi:hypothetical protein
MLRSILAATVATAALLGATAAHAGTHWSIGINVPLPGVVVSNGGYYADPAPVYYAPPPPVYVPAPRYVEREVYYAPPPPPRVVYQTSYERRWDDRRWDDRRGHGWDRNDRRDGWDRGGRDGPHRGR